MTDKILHKFEVIMDRDTVMNRPAGSQGQYRYVLEGKIVYDTRYNKPLDYAEVLHIGDNELWHERL